MRGTGVASATGVISKAKIGAEKMASEGTSQSRIELFDIAKKVIGKPSELASGETPVAIRAIRDETELHFPASEIELNPIPAR